MQGRTVIVGSGVAAASLAQAILNKDPNAQLLLLEAGVKVKTKDFGLWEHYLVTGQLPYDKYKDMQYPQNDLPGENMSVGSTDVPLSGARVIAYGGSTLHWGGWAFRMKPEDFHLFSYTRQGADWPFDYEHLEPYYCQAEEYLGISGDSEDQTVTRSRSYPFPAFPYTLEDRLIADAMSAVGVTYGHMPIARHGVTDTTSKHAPCQTTGTCKYCPFGARYAATNFLNDMLDWNDYPHFEVRTGVVVKQVRMASKTRAVGVIAEVREDSGIRIEFIEADRVVVAAGAIESSKLLERSVSEFWPRGIGNDQDQLGRNFIVHPYFIFKGELSANPYSLQKEMDFPTLVSRYYDNREEQCSGKFILVNPPDTIDPKLVQQMRDGKRRSDLDEALAGPQTVSLAGMVEVFGRPWNRISNKPGDHPKDLTRMRLQHTIVDYKKDDDFDAHIEKVGRAVRRIFDAMRATLSVDKPSISWRADHAASTCRMGLSPEVSVVDPNLQVHGVDNLYVCSNAVFPSLGAVNPTLTLTALALRLGDHLCGQQEAI